MAQHDMDSAELEEAYNECHAPAASAEDSEAFYDNEEGARKLWAGGFRPIHAHDVKHHDQIAYRETWFGLESGPVAFTTVEEVAINEYEVLISTWDRGVVPCDECSEVWVRRTAE